MKQPARVSPFAARTSQEQKEQWIVWQSQRNATRPVTEPSLTPTPPPIDPPPVKPAPHPVLLHHGQYDAVIKRMSQAQRRTSSFVSTQPKRPAPGSFNDA